MRGGGGEVVASGRGGKGVFLGAVLENALFSLVRLVLELGRGMAKGRCAAARCPG